MSLSQCTVLVLEISIELFRWKRLITDRILHKAFEVLPLPKFNTNDQNEKSVMNQTVFKLVQGKKLCEYYFNQELGMVISCAGKLTCLGKSS